MRGKRILAFLLTVIVFATLVSCNSNSKNVISEENIDTNKDKNTDKVSNKETVNISSSDDLYPAFDMGGRTIRIATLGDVYYDSTHLSIDEDPMVEYKPNAQDLLNNVRRIEKKYNVRIIKTSMSKEEMVKSLDGILKSGEPEYDIYELSLHFAIPALVKGVALPIEDYIPKYCDAGSDKLFMSTLEAFGGEYLFNGNVFDPISYCMVYNADLIKELGLEDPITLYEKDEWNWQKFSEYARSATKDSDNDGVVDQYGIYSEPFALAGFLYANNGVIASNESDVLSSQNVIETMNFIDHLNHVDKSLKVLTDEERRDKGTNQKVLNDWVNGKTLFRASSNIYEAISLISSTDDFKVIHFL